MKTSIYYNGNDSLVVHFNNHIYEHSRVRPNSPITFSACDYYICKKSNIYHPLKKIFIHEFLDEYQEEFDISSIGKSCYLWGNIIKNSFNNPPEYLFSGGRTVGDWSFDKIYEELKKNNLDSYNKLKNKYLIDSDFNVKHEIISANRYSFLDYIINEFF